MNHPNFIEEILVFSLEHPSTKDREQTDSKTDKQKLFSRW